MSHTDRFGRSKGTYVRNTKQGLKGDGFLLDPDGNYLVSNKRIRQLQDPEEDTDAVNKQWTDSRWTEAMNLAQLCMEKMEEYKSVTQRLETKLSRLENRISQLEVVNRVRGK